MILSNSFVIPCIGDGGSPPRRPAISSTSSMNTTACSSSSMLTNRKQVWVGSAYARAGRQALHRSEAVVKARWKRLRMHFGVFGLLVITANLAVVWTDCEGLIDLEKFFDRVNHQRLMARLAQRVSDRRLLVLVSRLLTAKVVLPDGVVVGVDEGVPQGSPLSPLLSNIVLDELDSELARRGHRFVRYADDCNVYVRSEPAGQRVMAS
jgi:hypothetical protein